MTGVDPWRDRHGLLKTIKRVIAVVGCQRSGTTLTGQLLGAHPSALLIDEFDGLYPWFHAIAVGANDHDAHTAGLLSRAGPKYLRPADRVLSGPDGVTLATQIRTLVLKAPNLTYHEVELGRIPVPVTIVYPVRDPRAVVASMARLKDIDFVGNQLRLLDSRPEAAKRYAAERARMANEREPPFIRRAMVWLVKSQRSSAFRATGLQVHRFRYEDLVGQPVREIPALWKACALDGVGHAFDAHSVYVGTGPGSTDRTRPLDTVSVTRWREALDPEQQAGVLAATNPFAAGLGYV